MKNKSVRLTDVLKSRLQVKKTSSASDLLLPRKKEAFSSECFPMWKNLGKNRKQSGGSDRKTEERTLAYAQKLSRMVQCDTTSYPFSDIHPAEEQTARFREYHHVLETLFPLVHRYLEKKDLDGNLLYVWRGKSSEKPIVLMGHQDVVPAAGPSLKGLKGTTTAVRHGRTSSGGSPLSDGQTGGPLADGQTVDPLADGQTESPLSDGQTGGPLSDGWIRPPFSGCIADGKVWGRGSVDTKCSCMSFLQAIEELLAEDFLPPQDIYISSSCTEEWGGPGCNAIIDELKRRKVRPWLVCDEGGGIYTDPMPGVRGRAAMIGIAEKGRANVRFIARGKGGHASTPQRHSPIARLAGFVCSIEKHSPFRCRMESETQAMLEALAPASILPVRLIFQNLHFFRLPIEKLTPGLNGRAAAMLGSTITFTMASGSEACNVFPQEASLGANLRFAHHQDMEESLAVIRKLAKKHGLEMEVLDAAPCTRKADLQGSAYRYVEETIRKIFPGIITSPFVLTAATDAAFYDSICDSCIRFAPIVYGPEEKNGIHGINEALRYDCLPDAVDFYKRLIAGV